MSWLTELTADTDALDSAPSDCTCLHCHTQGYADQDNSCRYYSKNGQ